MMWLQLVSLWFQWEPSLGPGWKDPIEVNNNKETISYSSMLTQDDHWNVDIFKVSRYTVQQQWTAVYQYYLFRE